MPERITAWKDETERFGSWHETVPGTGPTGDEALYVPATTHQRTVEALERLVTAVANMRVPQNQAEAALQVTVTIGPALTEAQAVLARIKEAT